MELAASDGVHLMQMDLYNEHFRMYFYDDSQLYSPVDFNFSTGKFNIIGDATNADMVDGYHAGDFARSYNNELRTYLNGQSGDIRALVYQLPIGEYALSTTDSEYNGITFPIQGYCLISWFPSKSAVNDYMYGTLIIRPMSSIGATYICSVYNTYSYTDWEQISTTPIKSTTFSGTTGNSGNMVIWATSERKIPLFVEIVDCYGLPFLSSSSAGCYMMHAFDSNGDKALTTISGTVYYIEI